MTSVRLSHIEAQELVSLCVFTVFVSILGFRKRNFCLFTSKGVLYSISDDHNYKPRIQPQGYNEMSLCKGSDAVEKRATARPATHAIPYYGNL